MAFSTTELQLVKTNPSQRILHAILNSSREAMLIVDDSMRITAANVPAQEAFSRQIGSLEDRRLSEVIRDLDLHEGFQEAIGKNRPVDLRIEFPGIEKRTYDVHVAPIELENGRQAIGVFYDITQIERLERVRQEFLSNISHELRTPLTSIIAYVETLEDGAIEDPDNNRRFLGVIRRNAERM
jgi:two-component system phosphate regulon sensor histidine kinase PhoR